MTLTAPPGTSTDSTGTPKPVVRRRSRRSALAVVGPLAVFAVLLGIWYFISTVVLDPDLQFLLPPPHQIITEGFGDPDIRAELLEAQGRSTQVALTGLAAAIVI